MKLTQLEGLGMFFLTLSITCGASVLLAKQPLWHFGFMLVAVVLFGVSMWCFAKNTRAGKTKKPLNSTASFLMVCTIFLLGGLVLFDAIDRHIVLSIIIGVVTVTGGLVWLWFVLGVRLKE